MVVNFRNGLKAVIVTARAVIASVSVARRVNLNKRIQHVGYHDSLGNRHDSVCGGCCSGGDRDWFLRRSPVVQAHLRMRLRMVQGAALLFMGLGAPCTVSASYLTINWFPDNPADNNYSLLIYSSGADGNNNAVVQQIWPGESAVFFVDDSHYPTYASDYALSVDVDQAGSLVDTQPLGNLFNSSTSSDGSDTVLTVYSHGVSDGFGGTLNGPAWSAGHSALVWQYILTTDGGMFVCLLVGFFLGWYLLSPLEI